jgi:hydroxyethylthiazole kinase-like uncharacterized protein yjeF
MSQTLLELSQIASLESKYARLFGSDYLMARAGRKAALYIADLIAAPATVTVLCGPGNNGGDGFVAACELRDAGYKVQCVQVAGIEPKTPEAKAARAKWEEAGGFVYEDPYNTEKADVVVDAMFGTGLKRPLKDLFLDAALWFNERQAIHVALDVPSGLDSQTGHWLGRAMGCVADHTITFLAGKPGLLTAHGPDAAGHIHIDNLGVSVPLSRLHMTEPVDFRHVIEPRKAYGSKRTYGRVGVIGGGKGTVGAAVIAARSALRMGAGAVYLELVEEKLGWIESAPEIMMRDEIKVEEMDALVVGPGLGFSDKARERVWAAVRSNVPLVLDADALSMMSEDEELLNAVSHREAFTVVTPHSGEAAKLLKITADEVEDDRVMRALDLAVCTGACSVLKGCGSIVTLRSSRLWINPTGTPALATAGSGDALAGMLGSFLAQGYDQLTATLAAVYLHGAAAEGCDSGILAGEIADCAANILQSWRRAANMTAVLGTEALSAHDRLVTQDIYTE